MLRSRTLAAASAAALASIALLGACSGGGSDAAASAAPSKVGGMTECTKDALQPAVTAAAEALSTDNQMPIDDLQCADGWAVAMGTLGPKNPPADGPQGAPTSMVFQAEGQFWVPQDKQKVCGTYDSNKPEEVPADATIPADLYTAGCLAG